MVPIANPICPLLSRVALRSLGCVALSLTVRRPTALRGSYACASKLASGVRAIWLMSPRFRRRKNGSVSTHRTKCDRRAVHAAGNRSLPRPACQPPNSTRTTLRSYRDPSYRSNAASSVCARFSRKASPRTHSLSASDGTAPGCRPRSYSLPRIRAVPMNRACDASSSANRFGHPRRSVP